MQPQTLRGKKQLLLGFTLFSMFFGAGNLIFPPYLGAQAGTHLWRAFLGFAVSAIGLPIAGVVAVARAGGLPKLAGRVSPRFAQAFTILVYLSIGPCLAIPRTASTSFAMLEPLLPADGWAVQLGYTAVFFAAAFCVALKPEKLTQRLGKVLCPALLALIVVLFAGCLLHPAAAGYAAPAKGLCGPARRAGHPGRLPDHGYAGRPQLWGRHRAEHSGSGRDGPRGAPSAAPSGRAFFPPGCSGWSTLC